MAAWVSDRCGRLDGEVLQEMTTARVIAPTHHEERPHDGIVSSEFSVGRYWVRMINHVDMIQRGCVSEANVEWEPSFPAKLTKEELLQYQEHRNRHYQRLVNIMGGTAMVVDI